MTDQAPLPIQRKERRYAGMTCQYIAGKPSDPKCGQEREYGTPYCPDHCAVCYEGFKRGSGAQMILQTMPRFML